MKWLRKRLLGRGLIRRLRHRLEYWGMKGLAALVPRLSRQSALRLARVIGWTAFHIDKRGRRLACDNLELARKHGNLELAESATEITVRECYNNFARNFVDLFWFSQLTMGNVSEWVDFDNTDALRELCESDQGGILLTPHFGTFEWASLIVGLLGLKLEIVVRDFRNPLVGTVFTDARQISGHRVHDREQVVLRLLRSLHRGTCVAMLPDLAVAPQRAAATVNMFGIPTTLSTVPAELAIRCNVPIIAAVCEPLAHGRARLKVVKVLRPAEEFSDSTDLAQRCTQAIWDAFEQEVRRRPECWMWMYRHWRFAEQNACSETTEIAAASTPVNSTRAKAA